MNTKCPRVGDRVYMKCPVEKAKSTHPKLTCKWASTVLEVSQISALITRIGECAEPIRVQFDPLRVIPSSISDDRIDTVTSRGKRGRKPESKVKCAKL